MFDAMTMEAAKKAFAKAEKALGAWYDAGLAVDRAADAIATTATAITRQVMATEHHVMVHALVSRGMSAYEAHKAAEGVGMGGA